MPRITPSTVVEYIDRGFPELRDNRLGTLDKGAHQPLAILVALADAVGDEIRAGLTA